MCSRGFDKVDDSEELSLLAGAYNGLGARKRGARVYFGVLAPCANEVYLVGSFNSWREEIRLSRNELDVWQTSIDAKEISDGDTYKFKAYIGDEVVYLSDPYAPMTDGEPFFNSIYKEGWGRQLDACEVSSNSACYGHPLNIYEIKTDGWLCYDDCEAVDYVTLSREILPYLLQMGYTHVCLSGICGGSFSQKQGGEAAFKTFVDTFHSAFVSVLVDWQIGCEDIGILKDRALSLINSCGVDGFVADCNDARTSEFFGELVHSIKSERPETVFIVRSDDGLFPSFADAAVKECGAYRKYFRQACDDDMKLRINAAAVAYLLLKDGRMLTRMGCEAGQYWKHDLFDRRVFESLQNARFQLFFSKLSELYLARSEIWGCGISEPMEADNGEIRLMIRSSSDSDIILATDLSGRGGRALIPHGEWNVILDSSSTLGYDKAQITSEHNRGISITLPAYGAVVLERIK